jgi:hypothetical protein
MSAEHSKLVYVTVQTDRLCDPKWQGASGRPGYSCVLSSSPDEPSTRSTRTSITTRLGLTRGVR